MIIFPVKTKIFKANESLANFIISEIPDYKVLSTALGARKDFKKAFSEGKSVVEYNKSSPASQEISALVKEISALIKNV